MSAVAVLAELLAGAADARRRDLARRAALAADTFNDRSPICVHRVTGGWLTTRGCWASVGAVYEDDTRDRVVGVVVTLGRLALAAISNPTSAERRARRDLEREWEKS